MRDAKLLVLISFCTLAGLLVGLCVILLPVGAMLFLIDYSRLTGLFVPCAVTLYVGFLAASGGASALFLRSLFGDPSIQLFKVVIVFCIAAMPGSLLMILSQYVSAAFAPYFRIALFSGPLIGLVLLWIMVRAKADPDVLATPSILGLK